jgi:prepilin-type N-terminal cleavage/methylation domain-containing protein
MNRGNRQLRSRRRGFTLMEVLVTMVLMGVVLPICLRAVSVARSAATSARRTSEAAALAQSKLAEIVASGDAAALGMSGDFQERPGYQWTCQNFTDAEGFTQITLTVTWQEQNRQRSFNLSTLISESTYSTQSGVLP